MAGLGSFHTTSIRPVIRKENQCCASATIEVVWRAANVAQNQTSQEGVVEEGVRNEWGKCEVMVCVAWHRSGCSVFLGLSVSLSTENSSHTR